MLQSHEDETCSFLGGRAGARLDSPSGSGGGYRPGDPSHNGITGDEDAYIRGEEEGGWFYPLDEDIVFIFEDRWAGASIAQLMAQLIAHEDEHMYFGWSHENEDYQTQCSATVDPT